MPAETNKAVVRAFVEAWNTRSFDRFNDLMGDHAVRRAGRTTYPPRPICGPVIRAAQVQ